MKEKLGRYLHWGFHFFGIAVFFALALSLMTPAGDRDDSYRIMGAGLIYFFTFNAFGFILRWILEGVKPPFFPDYNQPPGG